MKNLREGLIGVIPIVFVFGLFGGATIWELLSMDSMFFLAYWSWPLLLVWHYFDKEPVNEATTAAEAPRPTSQEENQSEENKKPLIQEEEAKKNPERERSIKLYEKFLSETKIPDNEENRERLKDEFKNWLKEKNI